jgi:hypothetical protein
MNILEQKFKEFDEANPDVWLLLIKFADEVAKTGRTKYSVKAIFERIRWHTEIETKSDTPFKLSNNHTAYYARKYMNTFPYRKGFFRLKKLRGDNNE